MAAECPSRSLVHRYLHKPAASADPPGRASRSGGRRPRQHRGHGMILIERRVNLENATYRVV
jgi:hypothetical protein